ncbi:MAG: HigA family addiction module antitoxin [Alphaproteobacteria bacterium]|jgi:addiction module HigA family antidote|nr:addiction module antidote protein, HigA family [Rhodospirillaceae bacterium]MDP6403861.1 HigA family addiction module antitoxin [Alphaproteobacteria bacterium]MDP6622218.1 HigA family addiction module antitoxin [Alphaproteobacteria bacterium]|tara:strand:+ start:371 stop:673 length:303 start_codon:yes stop_codon:yes gene_type:complete
MSKLPPIHPGEILGEEFLKPMVISQSRLARDINVPPRRINEICLGKRGITPDTALRLARYFGVSAEFWMTLQQRYDLESLRDRIGNRLDREIRTRPRSAA